MTCTKVTPRLGATYKTRLFLKRMAAKFQRHRYHARRAEFRSLPALRRSHVLRQREGPRDTAPADVRRPGTIVNTARIEELVSRVRSLPDPNARNLVLDLVQAIMDLHGSALARMMEVISETDPNGAVAGAIASDDLASSLLLLHDLHPLNMEARVGRALEQPALRAHGARMQLISVHDGIVRVRIEGGPALKTVVEQVLSNAVPDTPAIVIEGAAEALPANFVPVEQLLAS